MESVKHSLNYELPQELHFDQYAQHILENSRTPNLADTSTISLAAAPTITRSYDTLESVPSFSTPGTTSDFLKRLGATFIHSIQLQSLPRSTNSLDSNYPLSTATSSSVSAAVIASPNDIDMEFGPHHLVMDSHNYNNAMDELQKQLNYDKFMNEVWIGVVLTLIMISMIFCFCSCFLYHQFRMWKRNYRTTVTQCTDVEAARLNTDVEDPVPEYTLVSGLPSYEAALEILHKNPKSCLLMHPSVLEVFNKSEKCASESAQTESDGTSQLVLKPLLNTETNQNDTKLCLPSYDEATSPVTPAAATTPALTHNHSLASLLSLATQKSSQNNKSLKLSNTSSPSACEAEKQFKA